MTIEDFEEKVREYTAKGLKPFATSSFQTHSIVMLHLISRIDRSIPVYYLNTGFLFPETIAYKDRIAEEFGLNVTGLKSSTPKIQQKDSQGRFLYTSDPDYCCYLNKIQPMEHLLSSGNVWINGIRADQNANRAAMPREISTPQGALRFHPMLGWTNKMIHDYIREHNLPRHPLESQGYLSIGCEPCTRKMDLEIEADPRLSRWFGMNKTECGLHTELVNK